MNRSAVSFAIALSLASLNCSDAENQSENAGHEDMVRSTEVLNLFSWWVAPGEAEALEALEKLYKSEYKGARIRQEDNPTAGTWQEVLGEKIDRSPWDAFQLSASDLDNFRADHPGAVEPLDDVYDAANLDDVMIPRIKSDVTRQGHPYGVVMRIPSHSSSRSGRTRASIPTHSSRLGAKRRVWFQGLGSEASVV